MKKVDLILITKPPSNLSWPLGDVFTVSDDPAGIADFVTEYLKNTEADFLLFWDTNMALPDPHLILRLVDRPGDVWHAGLKLGLRNLPGMMNFVCPTWMLNRDPSLEIEASSWRVSLLACLVRIEVLQRIGFIHPGFRSLQGAVLEWGHRCIQCGVLMRHLPDLVTNPGHISPLNLPIEDEYRFVYYRFGRQWAVWAGFRAVMTGYASVSRTITSWIKVSKALREDGFSPYPHDPSNGSLVNTPLDSKESKIAKVSILIPTLDRYPYLHTLLCQLRKQTVAPMEIIIIDQSELGNRQRDFYTEFDDLPLRIFYQDFPGQCSSRNSGLQIARGNYILFLDDDDEVLPNLIEAHLENINRFGADVSSGIAVVPEEGKLPRSFTLTRISDVFPTGNTLIRSSALKHSGLFDLAYERNIIEDADLGMRIYLQGSLMILNPAIQVIHHHAPRGGLRTHKARVVTYASSRHSITQRHLPAVTEIYFGKRYFSSMQLREMLYLRVLGTLSVHGTIFRRLLKALISILMLPATFWTIKARWIEAIHMFHRFPQIPGLDSEAVSLSARMAGTGSVADSWDARTP